MIAMIVCVTKHLTLTRHCLLLTNPAPHVGGGVQIGDMLLNTNGTIESEQMKRMEAALATLTSGYANLTSEVAALKQDKAALMDQVGDLKATAAAATVAMPDMSWCPDGAKRVPTDVRWKGTIDGTGADGVIQEGVYCINDDLDLGQAMFLVEKGKTVEIIGRPTEGQTPPTQLRFGGIDIAANAVLNLTGLSIQLKGGAPIQMLCARDARYFAAIKKGTVSPTWSPDYYESQCKSGKLQGTSCCRDLKTYSKWRGGDDKDKDNEFAYKKGAVYVKGSLYVYDSEIAHSRSSLPDLLYVSSGGHASLVSVEYFDNVASEHHIYISGGKLTMMQCTVSDVGKGTSGDQHDGFAYAEGRSEIIVTKSSFTEIYGDYRATNNRGAFVTRKDNSDTSVAVSIDSESTFENCAGDFTPKSTSGYLNFYGCV